jgi:hypothetical protein
VSSFVYTIFNFYFGLVPNFRERDFICHEKNSFLFINCSIAILLIRNCLFFLKTLQRRPTTFSFQQKLAFLFRALALLFSNKFTEQLSLET